MSMVILTSGGLDSTLIAVLSKEEGLEIFPLFIDYGQICKQRELKACTSIHTTYGLPPPVVINISGFGKLIHSGLTDKNLDINADAFLPGRNLLFLLAACSYAHQMNANSVAIGLLSEKYHLFPDQTQEFILKAQETINIAYGHEIRIVTPLMHMSKPDVVELARRKGIAGTYSCHAGTKTPCGICVSCVERGKNGDRRD